MQELKFKHRTSLGTDLKIFLLCQKIQVLIAKVSTVLAEGKKVKPTPTVAGIIKKGR